MIPDMNGPSGEKVEVTSDTFRRAMVDCYQDQCENCPFASIGGLGKRSTMVVPTYITLEDATEYLAGYRAAAMACYGEDWETCSFGWSPALTIEATT